MEDFVIHYGADITQVVSDLKKLERINATIASQFGQGFAKATRVVGDSVEKISTTPVTKKVGDSFKTLQKTVSTTAQVIQTSDGKFRELGKTQTFLDGKLVKTSNTLKNVSGQFGRTAVESAKASKQTKTFGQNMSFLGKRALTVIPIWLALRSTFMAFLRLIKTSLKFLVDWEYQMAQIKIVGKESEESIENLSDSMLHLATSLGIANAQLGEATKLFIQQGRSITEIIPLLDATAKLSLLTGRTIVQSVEDLTAVLKAYNLSADSSITVIDSITNVMLNNAITAGDLASAYKQVASTASVLGVSLSGLTGFITAIKAETRDAGGKIGLALRTMFTRITTVSAEALQQLTGIPLFLDETGKKTKIVTGTFRNLEKALADISIWFATASNAQQAQVARLIGGVRRTNQAIVLFKNFNQVIKAQTDSLLGLGKADRAIEELTKTSRLRIVALSNAWKEFVDVIGDSGAIANALNFLKNQIQGITALLDPDRAFFVGLKDELKEIGQESQRSIQLAKNFNQLIGLTGNLSEQMGLAKSASELELIKDRVQIVVEQVQAFNRINTDFKIDITPTLDAEDLNQQLEAQKGKFIDFQIKAQINFERTQLQDEFISIGRELQNVFNRVEFLPGEQMSEEATDVRRQFNAVANVIKKISEGQFINQDELKKVTVWAERFEFAGDKAEGLKRKFDSLAQVQNDLVGVSGRESEIRAQITRQVEREIILRKTSQQVSEDLFQAEVRSIRKNKTKQELLEDQLKILERQDQVLTDQLENRLKNIRKELEKIRASEEQNTLTTIINAQVERLRLAGALNSEIIKRKTLLDKNFNISKTFSENLKRRLQLEKEINAEKRLKADLPSDELKIFRIARDEGIKTAKTIRDVLSGALDFSTFVRRGGEELESFKLNFPDIFEQQQAKAFKAGEIVPGQAGLRGFDTTIEDTSGTSLTQALIEIKRVMEEYNKSLDKGIVATTPITEVSTTAQQLNVTAQVDAPVTITAQLDPNNLNKFSEKVGKEVAKGIKTKGTELNDAVNEAINNF